MKAKLTSVIITAAGLALLGATSSLEAATITVTSTADSGGGSLRAAIASAVSGDTIDFAVTGRITLTSGELLVNKNLTILGPGPSSLAVDGNNTSRVFRIAPSTPVRISGLTITNGYGDGGGIINSTTLTVSNCVLNGNSTVWYGGAICNSGGTLTLVNSTLNGNSATWYGGAICNSGGTLTIVNSTLKGNSVWWYGGAIHNSQGATLIIRDCTLTGNSNRWYGGGIDIEGPSNVQISSSTLSDNFAGWYGGGICNGGTLTLRHCTLSGNSTYWYGGGIYNGGSASVQILSSTLSGNNSGFYYGGAICNDGFDVILRIGSSILNAGVVGENITGGSVTSLGYNLSSDAAGGWLRALGDRVNTDPGLGPLQDNGGPTLTHALLGCSPAIDQGKNLGASATDQRGLARRFDDPLIANAAGGDGTDIGAIEAQTHVTDTTPPAITCPANVTVNRTPGLPTGVATFPPPAVRDNCDPNPTVTCTPPSGSPFPYGTTIVTCQAVDASGNTNQCYFTVAVVGLPPVPRAMAAPAFGPLTDTNALLFAVVSANNLAAVVTLDGSASSDPDLDPLTFAWSEAGVTFSTDPVTTAVLGVGSHQIQLAVFDGGLVRSTTITVEVITPCQAIETLIWAVDAAGIRRQDSQPLIVSLKSACEAFDRGSIGAGVNKLQAFQQKVTELVAPTNPTAAAELIALAQQIIDAINAQPAP